jgi:hypothetical protein
MFDNILIWIPWDLMNVKFKTKEGTNLLLVPLTDIDLLTVCENKCKSVWNFKNHCICEIYVFITAYYLHIIFLNDVMEKLLLDLGNEICRFLSFSSLRDESRNNCIFLSTLYSILVWEGISWQWVIMIILKIDHHINTKKS